MEGKVKAAQFGCWPIGNSIVRLVLIRRYKQKPKKGGRNHEDKNVDSNAVHLFIFLCLW